MVLLDDHLATGTESTYTYTSTLNMKTKYAAIHIYITGAPTATLEMHLKINGNTDYDSIVTNNDSGTITGALLVAQGQFPLLTSGYIDTADLPFLINLIITFDDSSDHFLIDCTGSAPHEGVAITKGADQSTDTIITSLVFTTSTSTWKAGTRIITYGILS